MKDATRLAAQIAPVFIWLTFGTDSHAYLDAGTGSIILQAVVGGLFGALLAIKLFWNQIKFFLGKVFSVGRKHGRNEDPGD